MIQLLARFPRLRSNFPSQPLIGPDHRSRYPTLADAFAVVDEVLTPAFVEFDAAALREQNRYRRQQVLVLLGSALLTGLGGLQATLPDQRWPGLALAFVAAALAASSQWAKERGSLSAYLDARMKAERLRMLHFRYLSETGPFAGPDRVSVLRRAVLAIRAGKEPE